MGDQFRSRRGCHRRDRPPDCQDDSGLSLQFLIRNRNAPVTQGIDPGHSIVVMDRYGSVGISGPWTGSEWVERVGIDLPHSRFAITGAVRPAPSPPGHQFQSPATRSSAGPITIRTRVASMSTATASVNPSILTTRKLPKVNAANTTIMIAAALVISPAVLAIPSAIASSSLSPLLLASSTRATRNTS